jgi:hypothetical protein
MVWARYTGGDDMARFQHGCWNGEGRGWNWRILHSGTWMSMDLYAHDCEWGNEHEGCNEIRRTEDIGNNPKDNQWHQFVISYDDNGHTFRCARLALASTPHTMIVHGANEDEKLSQSDRAFRVYYDGENLHEHDGANPPATPSTGDGCYIGVNIGGQVRIPSAARCTAQSSALRENTGAPQ